MIKARVIFLFLFMTIGVLSIPALAESQELIHVADINAPVQAGILWVDCAEGIPCIYPGPHVSWNPYDVLGAWVDTGVNISDWLDNNVPLVFLSFSGKVRLLPFNLIELTKLERAYEGEIPDSGRTSIGSIESGGFLFHGFPVIGEITFGVSHDDNLLVSQIRVGYTLNDDYNNYYLVYGNDCSIRQESDSLVLCPGDEWPMPLVDDIILDSHSNIRFSIWRLEYDMDGAIDRVSESLR